MFQPDNLSSFALDLGYDPSEITIVENSISFTSGIVGAGGEVSKTPGSLSLGGIALPAVTDLTQSIFEFEATVASASSSIDFSSTRIALNNISYADTTTEYEIVKHAVSGKVSTSDGDLLSGVDLTIDVLDENGAPISGKKLQLKSDENGTFDVLVDDGIDVRINGALAYDSSDRAITPHDALETLRLAIGLETTAGRKTPSDYIAADFNQDGLVTPDDALGVLKYAVGHREVAADWVFIDPNADFSNISKDDVNFATGAVVENLAKDAVIELEGILIGDIDLSYDPLFVDLI
jgi:hypothetical protein